MLAGIRAHFTIVFCALTSFGLLAPCSADEIGLSAFELAENSSLAARDANASTVDGDGEGGSLDCQSQCSFNDGCQAFAQREEDKACVLASGAFAFVPEPGVTAGKKLQTPRVKHSYDPLRGGLVWRDDDTDASFVERVRAAAKPMGGPCEGDKAALETLRRGFTVQVSAAKAVAGKPFSVDWSTSEQPQNTPVWLVVATDRPVHFDGDRFYALGPQAIGPFGLSAGRGQTRAVAALFGVDAVQEGKIDMTPLEAGPLRVSVFLAGLVRRCSADYKELVLDAVVTVAPAAAPTFFVHDPFSFEAPQKTLIAPDSATKVEVYDGRFRLLEAEGGAVLADRNGASPNFSPTGRFLIVRSGDGYELLDTVDGSVLTALPQGDVAWENGDSFVVLAKAFNGEMDVFNPLHPGFRLSGLALPLVDCHVCSSRDARFTIDLENDVLILFGGQGFRVWRLSTPGRVLNGYIKDVFDRFTPDNVYGIIDSFVTAQTGAAPVFHPIGWNFRGGLKLSAFDASEAANVEDADEWPKKMSANLVRSAEVSQNAQRSSTTLQVSAIGQWRGAEPLQKPRALPNTMLERLEQFGIKVSTPLPPTYLKRPLEYAQAGPALAQRIMESVPSASGLFTTRTEDYGCLPSTADGKKQIYSMFTDAVEYKLAARTLWLTLFSCQEIYDGPYILNFHLFDSADAKAPTLIDENNPSDAARACEANIGNCGVEMRFYRDGNMLIWSKASRALMLYDVNAKRAVFRQFSLPRGDLLKEALYSAEDHHVVQVNTDGSFFVYDTQTGGRVLEGRYVDDETIAWTPDLRFDASPEGANYVSLRFPGQRGQYTFQQFSRAVRKPGLVPTVLSRRYSPGQALVAVPPELSGTLTAQADRIHGDIATNRATELRVYQDGLLTDTLPAAANGTRLPLDVKRLPGTRWVSLVAASEQGLVSLPLGRNLFAAGDPLPTIHMLTVGIDRYDGAGVANLRFARRDAQTLFDALAEQDGKSLHLGVAAAMTDADASPAAILAKTQEIVAKAKAGETIVFSFAGHGITNTGGRFFMATTATSLQAIAATSLSWNDLADVLARSKARVIVFLDACHSGAAGTSLFATNDEAAGDVLQAVPSGILVFSASKGRQLSEEAEKLGGGVFTNAVADVITRQRTAYDLDGDGVIEVSELYAGVKRRVSDLTDGRQVPWLARNELVGDFGLF